MTHTHAPAGVSHYYQRPAELSTPPSWQLTDPAGPERGHAWHWHEAYPESHSCRTHGLPGYFTR